ncbi:MAG: hypothetical protein P1U39_04220 [Legionellaceae bacterium]|nr:hypothetical protein [Legionellaceae bacterium]
MPTLMNMTTQNIEQTLTELTKAWVQDNIHDFPLLKTSMLQKEPIPAIMDELRKHIQTLQQQEEARITRDLQVEAIYTQTTHDKQEAIRDKQEEHDDNVDVIGSRIETLRYELHNRGQEKEKIKYNLEDARDAKLDAKVKELINQAIINQIREDETQSDNDKRDARTDKNLEHDLDAVEQKIIEANAQLTQKKAAVQARIDELNNQYQDDPKQLQEKTGQSAFDYVNVGNWQNRDETLQKLRRHEKKATDALSELKAEKKRLNHAIQTRPDRERQRQKRNVERKSRKQARKAAEIHTQIARIVDVFQKDQPETNVELDLDVIQQLSSTNALSLQSAISRARDNINLECETKIQRAFHTIDQKIAGGNAEISRLTERLKGVFGRVEKRRIQAENRQKRSDIRHLYPDPSTDSGWEAQLSSDVRCKLFQDIGLEQREVEQKANNLYSQAQEKSWSILFNVVRQKRGADADDKSINALTKICDHIAHHQQSLRELKQLESDLATMRGQVNRDENKARSLSNKIALNQQQIDANNVSIINQQEGMSFLHNQVTRSDEENASLRTKTLGYAALAAVLLITVAVIAVGFLPAGPIVGAIVMSGFAIAAMVSINSYMEWGTASRTLEQHKSVLTDAQDTIHNAGQNHMKLTSNNDDLAKQIAALENSISETNQRIEEQQNLISNKTYHASRSLELAQVMTPDNFDQLVLPDGEPSAPLLASATVSQQGMFNDDLPVADVVVIPGSGFSMK